MKKSILFNILKFTLAAALITWLINSGKLDFEIIKELLSKPLTIIAACLLLLFNHFLSAARWKIILDHKSSQKLQLRDIFKANWIGIFFNSVLPGSVSGDLIKVFYVKDLNKDLSKKYLFVSVLIDRVLGLFGLISLGGIVSIIQYTKFEKFFEAKKLIDINIALFIVVIVCLSSVFFFQKVPHLIAKPFREVPILGGIVSKLEELWSHLCVLRRKLIKIWLMSMFIQGNAALIFWFLVRPFIETAFSLDQALTILPIGFITIALPISPAGLGVGHAAFESLFGYFNISGGANFFNIFFLMNLITNLTGIIPYVLFKKEMRNIKNE